jgi:hypothetical protein
MRNDTPDKAAEATLPESASSLWRLTGGPLVWAAHFLLSYVTVAIVCAKATGPDMPLGATRIALLVYTVLAVAGIVVLGWRALRQHMWGHGRLPHDDDSPGDRHRFLGFATLLLCGLSLVAVVFTAMAMVVIGTCR